MTPPSPCNSNKVVGKVKVVGFFFFWGGYLWHKHFPGHSTGMSWPVCCLVLLMCCLIELVGGNLGGRNGCMMAALLLTVGSCWHGKPLFFSLFFCWGCMHSCFLFLFKKKLGNDVFKQGWPHTITILHLTPVPVFDTFCDATLIHSSVLHYRTFHVRVHWRCFTSSFP